MLLPPSLALGSVMYLKSDLSIKNWDLLLTEMELLFRKIHMHIYLVVLKVLKLKCIVWKVSPWLKRWIILINVCFSNENGLYWRLCDTCQKSWLCQQSKKGRKKSSKKLYVICKLSFFLTISTVGLLWKRTLWFCILTALIWNMCCLTPFRSPLSHI